MTFTHWLNFDQFADNDDFAASLTQLNKLSRELSTGSVDTFLAASCAGWLTMPRDKRSGHPQLALIQTSKT